LEISEGVQHCHVSVYIDKQVSDMLF
jgi:hypothetical protein